MTGTIWWTIGGATVVTALIKAFGPVVMGGRDLPPRLGSVIGLMAPALLAALVVSSALADGEHLHVGADTAGVAAGTATLLLTRAGVVTAVVVAAGVTAAIRLLA